MIQVTAEAGASPSGAAGSRSRHCAKTRR